MKLRAQQISSPLAGFKNYIINGNFDIWQRGTNHSTSGYGSADRWGVGATGSSFAHSQQQFTLGQSAVPNEPKFFSRTVVTSVAGASNYIYLGQTVESVRSLAGKTATLSFYAKADAAKNIAVEFLQSFGTGGAPSAQVNTIGVTTIPLTTSWQKFVVVVSVPSIAGKTLGTNGDDYLFPHFWFDAGTSFNARTNSLGQQSGTFDIAQVQLEEGSIATNFEYRPPATELALCQRYYEYIPAFDVGYALATNTTSMNAIPFCVRKRAPATCTVSSFQAATGNSGTPAIGGQRNTNVMVYNSANNWTIGAQIAAVGISADAEL